MNQHTMERCIASYEARVDLEPRGRSGGILLGVKCETLEVLSVIYGEFAVKF